MFAYLLIAFEVILLSSVYYYIFLREPRPFEIKEDIWGYYPLNDGTEHGAFQQTTLKRAKRAHPSETILRSSRYGVRRKITKLENSSELKNGWASIEQQKPSSTLGILVEFLAKQLSQLSVKLS